MDYDLIGYEQINNSSFIPIFREDVEFTTEAFEACSDLSGQFYQSCLFDVTVTGDSDFAEASRLASQFVLDMTSTSTPDSSEPKAEISSACFQFISALCYACWLIILAAI